jgi:hypothetical protein
MTLCCGPGGSQLRADPARAEQPVRRSKAFSLLLMIPVLVAGCSTFRLREQSGVLAIAKQRRASDDTLQVMPFPYTPEDPKDSADLTPEDLSRWQELLASAIDQSNVFAVVQAAPASGSPAGNGYVLMGRITNFKFEKNWVPTLFPIHLGLSFLTFTGYTLFGGPTTATIVRFAVHFELRHAGSSELVTEFDESYRSTRAVNIYSKGAENPYDNPNLVFAQVVTSASMRIAAALPYPASLGAPAEGMQVPE